MTCEWCGATDGTVTDGPACMIPHCGACFWSCQACLSDMADDIQGELF